MERLIIIGRRLFVLDFFVITIPSSVKRDGYVYTFVVSDYRLTGDSEVALIRSLKVTCLSRKSNLNTARTHLKRRVFSKTVYGLFILYKSSPVKKKSSIIYWILIYFFFLTAY